MPSARPASRWPRPPSPRRGADVDDLLARHRDAVGGEQLLRRRARVSAPRPGRRAGRRRPPPSASGATGLRTATRWRARNACQSSHARTAPTQFANVRNVISLRRRAQDACAPPRRRWASPRSRRSACRWSRPRRRGPGRTASTSSASAPVIGHDHARRRWGRRRSRRGSCRPRQSADGGPPLSTGFDTRRYDGIHSCSAAWRRRRQVGELQPGRGGEVGHVGAGAAGDGVDAHAVAGRRLGAGEHGRGVLQLVEAVDPGHAVLAEHGRRSTSSEPVRWPVWLFAIDRPSSVRPDLDAHDRHAGAGAAVGGQQQRAAVLEALDVGGDDADLGLRRRTRRRSRRTRGRPRCPSAPSTRGRCRGPGPGRSGRPWWPDWVMRAMRAPSRSSRNSSKALRLVFGPEQVRARWRATSSASSRLQRARPRRRPRRSRRRRSPRTRRTSAARPRSASTASPVRMTARSTSSAGTSATARWHGQAVDGVAVRVDVVDGRRPSASAQARILRVMRRRRLAGRVAGAEDEHRAGAEEAIEVEVPQRRSGGRTRRGGCVASAADVADTRVRFGAGGDAAGRHSASASPSGGRRRAVDPRPQLLGDAPPVARWRAARRGRRRARG